MLTLLSQTHAVYNISWYFSTFSIILPHITSHITSHITYHIIMDHTLHIALTIFTSSCLPPTWASHERLTFVSFVNVHSFLLFIAFSSGTLSIITASVIILLVGLPKHSLKIVMSISNIPPSWYNSECLTRGHSSSTCAHALTCSFVLSYALLPVCPLYTCSCSIHFNWYTHPRLLQLAVSPREHIGQSSRSHGCLPKGFFSVGHLLWSHLPSPQPLSSCHISLQHSVLSSYILNEG